MGSVNRGSLSPPFSSFNLQPDAPRDTLGELAGILRPVPVVRGDESLVALADRFDPEIPVVAVVDDRGRPIGVIRAEQFLGVLDARSMGSVPGIHVSDSCAPAGTVPLDASLQDAIQAMVPEETGVLLAVRADGTLAGAILALDLLAASHQDAPRAAVDDTRIRDLHEPTFTMAGDAPLATVARLFAGTSVRGLLGLNHDGSVAGVIVPQRLFELARERSPQDLARLKVADLPKPPVVLLDGADPPQKATGLLLAAGAAAGVVMDDGVVAGVVWPEVLLEQQWKGVLPNGA